MPGKIQLLTFATALGMSLGAMAAPVAAPLAELKDIRVDKTTARTRFVFDLSEATSYRFFTLGDPTRVVIDLHQLQTPQVQPQASLDDTAIARIRTGQQADGSIRYVFDLTHKSHARAFALKPEGERGHRVVVDIDNVEVSATEGLAQPPEPNESYPELQYPRRVEAKPASVGNKSPGRVSVRPRGSLSEWSGSASLDSRLFFDSPEYPRQRSQNASLALRPEYFREWDGGKQQLSVIAFGRLDSSDSERTHADIRELYWRIQQPGWAIKAGADVVFWGVTESQHLVDIINQTDLVENIDGEDKLGQPMLNLNLTRNWGTLDFYMLPWFRERTFPGERGRLRTPVPVDTNNAIYDSSDEEDHIDYALRWNHYIGNWDIGLAHFTGTSREPLLIPEFQGGTITRLSPYYAQIDQTSLDAQATMEQWLWKLEAIYNNNDIEDYYAYIAGFEYTYVGIGNSSSDLGLLLEYHYDERDERSTTGLQDDVYVGVRWTGNDHNSTEILAGLFVDTDSHGTLINIEASRRLGESWLLSVQARIFQNAERGVDPLYFLRADDYIELQLKRYF